MNIQYVWSLDTKEKLMQSCTQGECFEVMKKIKLIYLNPRNIKRLPVSHQSQENDTEWIIPDSLRQLTFLTPGFGENTASKENLRSTFFSSKEAIAQPGEIAQWLECSLLFQSTQLHHPALKQDNLQSSSNSKSRASNTLFLPPWIPTYTCTNTQIDKQMYPHTHKNKSKS